MIVFIASILVYKNIKLWIQDSKTFNMNWVRLDRGVSKNYIKYALLK